MTVRPDTWTARLLNAIGAPVTDNNATFLMLWHQAEGGSARNNWLNTTQNAPGATNYNSVGVKNYPDEATGIAATAQTLKNGRYSAILAAMQRSDIKGAAEAVVASPWGTGPALLALAGDATTSGRINDPVSKAIGSGGYPSGNSGALGAATAVGDAVMSVPHFLALLANRHTWVRVLEVTGGLGMVVAGGWLLQKGSVANAAKAVGNAVPGAAASAVVTKAPGAVAAAL